jgi:hypothetical protein
MRVIVNVIVDFRSDAREFPRIMTTVFWERWGRLLSPFGDFPLGSGGEWVGVVVAGGDFCKGGFLHAQGVVL